MISSGMVPGLAKRCTSPSGMYVDWFSVRVSTVMVLLQTQAGFGLDLNAFDFEAATFVDTVVPTPRTVDFTVERVFFAFCVLQLRNDVLHILAAALVGHEHRVGGFHNDEVAHANQADQTA